MSKQVKKGKKANSEAVTLTGIVSRVFNKQVTVLVDHEPVQCPLSGGLMRQKDSCVIGDEAKLELTGPGQYQITEILPRRNELYRGNRRVTGENILIAANPTMVVAVVTAEYMLHQTGFAEQAILAAHRSHLPIAIYVSKCDEIREETMPLLEEKMKFYSGIADYCMAGSNRKAPTEITAVVTGQAAVLVGDRDSGKTALMHGILRELDGEEAPPYIRQSTSAANLLISAEGTILMDTPGFRDFALNQVTEEERQMVCDQLGDIPQKPAKKLAPKPRREETRGPLVEDAYGNVHADYRNNACLETFTCQNCGATVIPEGAGSKHRNHCPNCLCSVHVDNEPGDRASLCHGTMDPIAVWVRKGGEWALIHKCRQCGNLSSNRVAADDNPMLLMSIAVKPLANPPFPLSQLQDATKQPE